MDRPNEPFRVPIADFTTPTGHILSTIEVASHRTLFDFFKRIRSDDNGLYAAQFDVLLGAYCNTLTFVRFLELGLSVACVCTKFPELNYVNEGTIQFEVQQPMIARDGPHPVNQPIHNYMAKRIDRRSLSAAFSIAAEALGLITETSIDGTHISTALRTRAIQQLARNIQAALDAFERGTADQLLRVLLEKAPPLSLLAPLRLYRDGGHSMGAVANATLLSELKRRVIDEMFFMTKYDRHRDVILTHLNDLVNCTAPSVAIARLTHSDTKGRPVDGVLITTSGIRQRLLRGIVNVEDSAADVPVTYGEMMITGGNLVTALVMGKAVRNLDDVARNLLGFQKEQVKTNVHNLEDYEDNPRSARVRADLVQIGDRLVFLEALEKKVYQATQVPYPLIGNLDLTFIMPLGVFKPPSERYARHAGSIVPAPGQPDSRVFPPRGLYFFNKDGVLQYLSFESAIGTVCHSSFLDIEATILALRQIIPELNCVFGAYVAQPQRDDLPTQMRHFGNQWRVMMPNRPRWVLEALMTTDQFLSPGNQNLIFELHPAFDFFVIPGDVNQPGPPEPPQVMPGLGVSLRIINGNIPLPLCPIDFRDTRGLELSVDRHRLSPATVAAVRGAFRDQNYPMVLYIIEAVIHGSERIFCGLARLIIQCIKSYWQNSHNVAFVNNFYMVMYINIYLCNGELPEECTTIYRELLEHTRALWRLVGDHTLPAEPMAGRDHEELNNILMDHALLPPLIWDCDPLIYRQDLAQNRVIELWVGDGDYNPVPWVEMAQVNFRNNSGDLIHNKPVRGENARAPIIPHHGPEWSTLSKIYYYTIVPAFSRGNCCTMGIRYDRVYQLVQSLVIPDLGRDEEAPASPDDPRHPLNPRHLVANSFNVMFHNGRIMVDTDALLVLQDVVTNMAERTTPILTAAGPDVGATTATTREMRTFDGTLHHGLLMMAYQRNDETLFDGTFFYPAPVNALFACPDHLAALPGMAGEALRLARDVPPVPPFLGANYYATVRQPVAQHAALSKVDENTLTYALMAGYFKMTPLAFIHQFRTGLHPGFALTVIRQDRFSTENILFAEKASESYFMGQLQVSRHEAVGGVNFTLTQPRANVDLGVGFTAVYSAAALRTPITDMGNLPQNLYLTRGSVPLLDVDTDNFLRRAVNSGNRLDPQEPAPLFGQIMPRTPVGITHGQAAICEFIVTPVSADLNYFRRPCNPRGRTTGMIYTGDGRQNSESIMFDHSQGDPAYPNRATINPWASQRHSYGDRLYNGAYNLSGASPVYSPCFKFFTPTEVENKHRSLAQLLVETGSSLAPSTASTEIQFKRPPGASELVEDPCGLFQEAYPPLSSSDIALLRTSNNNERGTDETHLAQYLIRDGSPLKGCIANAS
ncbi:major capsid protein [Felid alphaherpesvirus 1]|uniref:Major capsid protein n=1 Tax=Feline herpesvirus 1 TaxID=10334 RepID=D1FXW3_FHV1|nr:major capsid protein [Felid alphaherpesvirus 1]AMN88973.1 major capsid protein [synthetic construct]ACT88339.1 major capsid protein [Felid alphaherpesvirus 1]ALJ84059.1 major capsid protein [Felid alphaherpesvirus 1]ALJ84135.1 major capsid protein [Felid alphaherpesvirus 1]ALJ84211.1 major capsid protein [Felid alphaherpesvirus 1]